MTSFQAVRHECAELGLIAWLLRGQAQVDGELPAVGRQEPMRAASVCTTQSANDIDSLNCLLKYVHFSALHIARYASLIVTYHAKGCILHYGLAERPLF